MSKQSREKEQRILSDNLKFRLEVIHRKPMTPVDPAPVHPETEARVEELLGPVTEEKEIPYSALEKE